jgi:hypothetical protein
VVFHRNDGCSSRKRFIDMGAFEFRRDCSNIKVQLLELNGTGSNWLGWEFAAYKKCTVRFVAMIR